MWDFSSAPRSYFFVERFESDADTSNWRRVEGPLGVDKDRGEVGVEGGYLYRVVGCADKSGAVNCLGSTVFWASLRPVNLDDIPDIVHTSIGNFVREADRPRRWQVLQYNVALIAQLVDSVAVSALPPMSDLSFSDLKFLPEESRWRMQHWTTTFTVFIQYIRCASTMSRERKSQALMSSIQIMFLIGTSGIILMPFLPPQDRFACLA